MSYFQESISEFIWDLKYRYRLKDKIMDKSIESTWKRAAKSAAKAEKRPDREQWERKFYNILEGFQFLPGGRILAGAGTRHNVTLFNCFVMPIKEDSLTGIFDAIKEGALTLQQGGGIGYDFSSLRPEGFAVKKIDIPASGPVSFMRIWNTMCATLLSTGARRGAMMGILRCDHPDIEQFIKAKSNPSELRHFNVSVLVTDNFIEAVKKDKFWNLVFDNQVVKQVSARQLWHDIMHAAYEYAEPGVLFEDTINRMNNLFYCENIKATNPCGEIPLPNYGACNLGAINLTQFIMNPFQPNVALNWEKLNETTAIATRFLDNVIDISRYPLRPQKSQALATRRIGLGFTGLGDALVMMGLRYGSQDSLTLVDQIMQTISKATWKTSIELAHEKAVFPLLNIEKYTQSQFVQQLPLDIQQDIQKYGIRNSHHNTIAPTGTISLLANNISNGLEPIFSSRYERTVRMNSDDLKVFTVKNYALRAWEAKSNANTLPPAWVDVATLTPEDHLRIQQAVQPYIDNAISKTINIPAHFPFEQLSDVYMHAFEYGLKGCTIFRPNKITGSVLTSPVTDDDVDRCCQV